MSGWRVVTKDLYAAGGGPLHPHKFDRCATSHGALYAGLARAKELGLVENTVSGWGNAANGRWALTQRGIDWCEGRIELVCPKEGPSEKVGRKVGSGMRPVATWLKALPRAGEIQLGHE